MTTVSAERDDPDEEDQEAICGPCRNGRHDRCHTTVWTRWTDTPTYCRCWSQDHLRRGL